MGGETYALPLAHVNETVQAARGRLRGLGITAFMETSRGAPGEWGAVRFEPDGTVAFAFKRPEIADNHAHDAGGLRFEVIEQVVALLVDKAIAKDELSRRFGPEVYAALREQKSSGILH